MSEEMPRSRQDASGRSECVIDADAVWEGKIESRGSLRIEGTAHGELEVTETLTVGSLAQVDGTVRARTIVLGGDLTGTIQCDDRLELLTGSSIGGDIEIGTLVVQEGAYIEATSFKMLKARPPSRRSSNRPDARSRAG